MNKYQKMSDSALEKELLKYSKERKGEIAELTYAAALRIGTLAGRLKVLEKMEDDGK